MAMATTSASTRSFTLSSAVCRNPCGAHIYASGRTSRAKRSASLRISSETHTAFVLSAWLPPRDRRISWNRWMAGGKSRPFRETDLSGCSLPAESDVGVGFGFGRPILNGGDFRRYTAGRHELPQ